jgi:hypothetical protein
MGAGRARQAAGFALTSAAARNAISQAKHTNEYGIHIHSIGE